jgi:predicted Zn-dependent protease with MMP-like domain/Flp pilus assembly protein TadD
LILCLIAGCGKKPQEPAALDGGASARVTLPSPGKDDHDVHDRPLVPCPVTDKYDLDASLDQSAAKYDSGDYATALACAEQAARIAPRSVEAHHDRAAALSALERWEEAKQAFTMALALDPDDAETLAGAAHLYINRLGPARDLTLIGLEYARRGSAHVGRRRGDRQLAARLALLEAQALDDLGHPDEALNAAEAALALDAVSVEAKYERAVSLFHLCRFDKARPAFEEVLRHEADDPFALHHLGLILEREGRLADAEAHLQRAIALAPDKFSPPVLLPAEDFQRLVDEAVRQLDPEARRLMGMVAIEIADLPALEDLTAVEPPFAPTILGLYRGAPIEGARTAARGEGDEPRAIVLYRKNLARAVTTRGELEKQVRITLLHEIGHLKGEDEDELRARGLE